jgi:ribonuclease BN (tRNA processing enzyme)
VRAYHTSDIELGRLAAAVRPKLLVLNHTMRMGGSDAELVEHVRAGGYRGQIVIGKDLAKY